jgi:hypothetical protein
MTVPISAATASRLPGAPDDMLERIRGLAATRVHHLSPKLTGSYPLTIPQAEAILRHLNGCSVSAREAGMAQSGREFRRGPQEDRGAISPYAKAGGHPASDEPFSPQMPPPMSALKGVPEGYYAVESRTGNNDLDFFRVHIPDEGKWKGYVFVERVIGGRPDAPVKGLQARFALAAILEAGVEEAKQRYGQEVGQCSECNRHLTDEESRRAGKGPYCRAK